MHCPKDEGIQEEKIEEHQESDRERFAYHVIDAHERERNRQQIVEERRRHVDEEKFRRLRMRIAAMTPECEKSIRRENEHQRQTR